MTPTMSSDSMVWSLSLSVSDSLLVLYMDSREGVRQAGPVRTQAGTVEACVAFAFFLSSFGLDFLWR